MPNHVQTKLTITGDKESLAKFKLAHLIPEDGHIVFDFNTITPCHENLYKSTSPTRRDDDLARAKDRGASKKEIKELEDEIKLAKENLEQFGYSNWYDFCCREWGTKWGAYGLVIEKEEEEVLVLFYETAWSTANPIFDKLNEMYPTLTFMQHVLDEGMNFGGTQTWDEDGYTETMYNGKSLYEFCNREFDADYIKCECGDWFKADWIEEGQDSTKCEVCNQAISEEA